MQPFEKLMTFNDGSPVSNQSDWEKRRLECIDILASEGYGYLPSDHVKVSGTVIDQNPKCCSGHAVLEHINITMTSKKGSYTAPVHLFRNADGKKHPFVFFMNFRSDDYDEYYPPEEIIDHGFNLGVVNYEDFCSDDADFTNGICQILERPTAPDAWGKISLWAYVASRITDYWVTRMDIDTNHMAIAGHSRLGKTALWCGAHDNRFEWVFTNDSGCMGDALNAVKHKGSETVASIQARFPYWFCENFFKYPTERELPFDQNWLVASIAPRYVCIDSASEDLWADPSSQQLTCVVASPAWEIQNLTGFTGDATPVKIGTHVDGGHINYFLRDGVHFMGRADWLHYMACMETSLKS